MSEGDFKRYHVRLRLFAAGELVTRTYSVMATTPLIAEQEARCRWYCEGLPGDASPLPASTLGTGPLMNIVEEPL